MSVEIEKLLKLGFKETSTYSDVYHLNSKTSGGRIRAELLSDSNWMITSFGRRGPMGTYPWVSQTWIDTDFDAIFEEAMIWMG